MTELAEPLALNEPRSGLLERAVNVRLRLGWEMAALAALVVLGAGFRFWDLGSRALHHDESLHGFYAYNLFQGHGYVHDPLMHGPFQFFGIASTFFLTGGASDYTLRVFPALFGSILIVLPFFFRSRLGSLGALFASALIAFSPTLLYYSRFARNDIYIAVFTLGIVISLWRYVDERKPLYLYTGAGLLGLSFATKEVTYLQVGLLMLILNGWLAAELAAQTRDALKLDRLSHYLWALAYFPIAWLVAATWRLTGEVRERAGLRELAPAGAFLIILGTFTLPQLSAAVQVPLERVGIEIGERSEGATLGVPDGGVPIVAGLLVATAVVGLGWNWRVWAIAAAAFYVPYILLYTSFFTHMDGFGSGIWGSLDYWLDEQRLDQPRGNQPWFYYLMLLPSYEFLPLVAAAPALFYYAIKGDAFRRFLLAWVAGTFGMYIWAGEKMPWLSVHTSLPAIILAAYALGDLFSHLPKDHKLQRVTPQVLPFVAACMGLAAVAFAAFGPDGAAWITLRVLLVGAALGALVWLLQPFDRQRLALGLAAAVLGGLALFTVRTGIVATYENGDVPRELLVYTQTSPQVPDVMAQIREAGAVSGLGRDVPVFVDNAYSWPWRWYLREYPNAVYGGVGEGFTPPADAIVVVALENDGRMDAYRDQYQTPVRHYLRWWFPEFDTYKTLPTHSVTAFFGEFIGDLFRPAAWSVWWSYFRDRDPSAPLGGGEEVAYFPKAYPVHAGPPSGTATPQPTTPPATQPTQSSSPLPAPGVDPAGRYALGQAGAAPGAFAHLTGVTVDGQGGIYVADTGNNRIQKFSADGEFVAQVGGTGTEPGRFNQPSDIAVGADGTVYVVDTWNHRIQVFDSALKFVAEFGRPAGDLEDPEPDQMWGPRAITFAADGNLLVSDTGTNRLKVFSPAGQVVRVVGSRGDAAGRFVEPVGVVVTPAGEILVADVGNARIQRFDADFNPLAAYPIEAWSDLNPDNKPYLALLPDGRLLATDAPQGQLVLIGADGSVEATLTQLAGTTFPSPRGVDADAAGFVYVTDAAGSRVLRFPLSDLDAP
jgi:predicted membrane-bound mannosyltransferase/sugar lactone lactonase YvrE